MAKQKLSKWDNSQRCEEEKLMRRNETEPTNNNRRFIEESYRRIFKYSV